MNFDNKKQSTSQQPHARKAVEQNNCWAGVSLKSPHPVLRVEAGGDVLYANAASAALFHDRMPQENSALPPLWLEAVNSVITQGETVELEASCDGRIYQLSFVPDENRTANIYAVDISELKLNVLRLRASEGRLRALIEKDANGMLVVDEDGAILFANPAVERILGRPRESLGGLPFGLPILQDGHAELVLPLSKGLTIVEIRVVPLKWKEQSAYLVTLNDVTEHRRRAQLLEHRNRTLAVLSECNHALVRSVCETELLNAFCENLRNIGQYKHAWVALSTKEDNLLTPCAYAGEFPATRSPDLNLSALLEDWSLIQSVFARREATIVNLYPDRPCDQCNPASDGGACNVALLPLPNELGVLGIHSKEASFDDEEVSLLEQLADDLAFGIVSLRTEQARKVSENLLRIRNRAMEATQNAIMITDAQQPGNLLVYVNPSFERITGYTSMEALGRNPKFLRRDDSNQKDVKLMHFLLRQREEGSVLLRNYRKDGSLFWNELHIAPVYDENGTLTHFVGVINDVTENKRYQEELEYQASHDTLTGLPNRHLMNDRLLQELRHGQRYNHDVAVMFLDLDGFKVINDSLGHRVGDRLLQAVSHRLSNSVRAGDTVVRHGGDEFVIILPDAKGPDHVAQFARRLLDDISEPIFLDAHELRISGCIGVSLFPRDSDDPDTLLKHADAAMYRAKEEGWNQFQFFTEALNARVNERFDIEMRLRVALREKQLFAVYQPQIDLTTGELVGAEALVRWKHPELGIIPPSVFIPIAEQTGLISPIGEWMLQTACREAKKWRATARHPITISINLSARQLATTGFEICLRNIIEETGLPPSLIEIELTESAIMRSSEYMRKQLDRIKAQGINLAVDDFGTGYSSLAHLREFAFDRLKLDISFVRDITSDPNTASIARTVIAMAKSMQLPVIAEGIETEAQLRYLQRYGCEHAQGYYFSPPVEAEPFSVLLSQGPYPQVADIENATRNILVLDDQANITKALYRQLRGKYKVYTATSAEHAFEILALHPIQVIISDQRMPGMTGTEFLSRVRELHPDAIRMILSGYTDLDTITDAVNRGRIYKFITKPWEESELLEGVADAFAQYDRNHLKHEQAY